MPTYRRTDVTVIRNAESIEYFDETYTNSDNQERTFTSAVVGNQVFSFARRCYRIDENGNHVVTNTVVGYNIERVPDQPQSGN